MRGDDLAGTEGRARLSARLLWFVGLWAASVAVVGAVAYGIRLWIVP